MTQRKTPAKPGGTPPKSTAAQLGVDRRVPQDTEAAPEPPGQLGVISTSLDEIDNYIDRITNLTKNISTRLFGSLAEVPITKSELPEGELYITPVRLADIQGSLREIETILDDTYNKL